MNKFYTLRELSNSGILPFRSSQTLVKEIKAGRLKAISRGDGLSRRYIISDDAVGDYLQLLVNESVAKQNKDYVLSKKSQ